ncbi:MAG TPA: GAF domain-containing protein, partial [Pilimelia sp.]|nr:GAF domain-containing protein [Pilimelia sp.]
MAPVRGDLGSYAGYPLQTSSGHVLGSLCVIDRQPRQWTGEQLALLGEVAAIVLQEIEHRLAARTIDDIRGLTGQLIVGLDGTVDAVRGLADLVEQQDDLRLHRFAAGALSKVDQVKDLTVRLQREAVDWVGRATGPASVDTREVVDLC